MFARQVVIQSPEPKIKIKRLDKNNLIAKEELSLLAKRLLCDYQFSLSKNDVQGSFSISFFPDDDSNNLFDELKILDIVEIYETKKEDKDYGAKPIFTGIIKNKKYVSQVSDGGNIRRLSISGICVAGLISQFYLNFDTTAMSITKQIVSNEEISKNLTLKIAGEDKKIKDVIKTIWKYFCDVAEQIGNISIKKLIDSVLGDDFFDIDNSTIFYPLANVMRGEATQDFFSLITGITPEPLYEVFAYTDIESGKMKLKIRHAPFFSDGDSKAKKNDEGKTICWSELFVRNILSNEVLSFDLSQSDNELYTVFYSYLNGYPMSEEKMMRLAALENDKQSPSIKYDKDKYNIYGYRPLIATFNGYDKSKYADDNKTTGNLSSSNDLLKEFFGQLDVMLQGSITLAMTYDKKQIMIGDVIGFLGGQFYVEGISHSWNYGAGGQINIAVSRGGIYDGGKFRPFEKVSSKTRLFENKIDVGIV